MIKRAMILANARGMKFLPDPTDETLAKIRCRSCGWPADTGFDVVIKQYVREPYGCANCTAHKPDR